MIGHRCVTRDKMVITRRAFLTTGVGSIVLSAGCLGDSTEFDPVELDDDATCAVCGMVIADHHGPAGQAYYEDEDPITFDSVVEMVRYDQDIATSLAAGFVTDYAAFEFEIEYHDETPYMPTNTAVSVFSSIDDVVFLVESTLHGAMGVDAMPFSDEEVAAPLIDEYGGSLLEWENLPDAL